MSNIKRSGLYITTRGTDGNIVNALCRIADKNEILSVRFYNWMYGIPPNPQSLAKAQEATKQCKQITNVTLVQNATFSSSHSGDVLADRKVGAPCIRVHYHQKARDFVKSCLESSGCTVYESNIPLEWRFVCHLKLSLFCPVTYENFTLKHVQNANEANALRQTEIPILYFMLGQPRLLFFVNISEEIVKVKLSPLGTQIDESLIALWICWGEKDADYRTNGGISCYLQRYLVLLRQVIYKLFDANANRNANKQVMHPYDMAVFESRCGVDLEHSEDQQKIITEFITGFIGIATQLPCTLDSLTRRKSKKSVADAILCSQCRPNTIIEPPALLPKFESMAIIKKFEDFAMASQTEEIWLLDFVSQYPYIILALSERCPRLEYAGKIIRHFLRLKSLSTGFVTFLFFFLRMLTFKKNAQKHIQIDSEWVVWNYGNQRTRKTKLCEISD